MTSRPTSAQSQPHETTVLSDGKIASGFRKLTPEERLERFYRSQNKLPNGCTEWTGGRTRSGRFGLAFSPQGQKMHAHLLAYILHFGKPVNRDEKVIQTCGNPLCVEATHLIVIKRKRPKIPHQTRTCVDGETRGSFRRMTREEHKNSFFYCQIPQENGCILWNGAMKTDGVYGLAVTFEGKPVGAHVLAYIFQHGHPVPPGKEVSHLCHNPRCVYHEHLIAETHAENMARMAREGRAASGERHPHRKIVLKNIPEIVQEYLDKKASATELAKRHGVSTPTIVAILKGERFKTVPRPVLTDSQIETLHRYYNSQVQQKWSDSEIAEVRKDFATGTFTRQQLAEKYQMSYSYLNTTLSGGSRRNKL